MSREDEGGARETDMFTFGLTSNPLDPLRPGVVFGIAEDEVHTRHEMPFEAAVQMLHDLGVLLEPFLEPLPWARRRR